MKRYQANRKFKSYSERKWEKKGRRNFIVAVFFSLFLLYSFFTWLLPALIGSFTFLNKLKPEQKPQTPIYENTTLAPPVLNIPYEATNSAAIKVHGYAGSGTKVEIYVDEELKDTTKTQEDGSFISENIPLNLGTNNIFGKSADDNGNQSLPSRTIRIIYASEKPKLEISSPGDNQTIAGGDKKITVSGKVTPVDGISVTVNGQRFLIKEDGSFSQAIDINEGENNITITAIDQAGNTTGIARKVTYQP